MNRSSTDRWVSARRFFVFLALGATFSLSACSASDAPSGRGNGANSGSSNAANGGSAGAGAGGSSPDPTGAGGRPSGQGGAGQTGGVQPGGGTTPQGVNPPVDPSIVFDWPETNPTLTCLPGHYAGTFTGMYKFHIGVRTNNYRIQGNITLTLVQSQNGEKLEISDGHIKGTTNFTIPFNVDLNGTLDCTQAKLLNGKLVNGVYTTAGKDYHYEGDIAADYDKQAHQFINGTWSVTEPAIPENGGGGAWQAGYTGP